MKKSKKLLKLFLTTLYISAFTFGGGFVISTFMKKKFVDEFHWIDDGEMLDLIAMAQSSPGAIGVNVAILVGWHVGGFVGMITAVIAMITPPMVILGVITTFYNIFATNEYVALFLKGMQAGVAAVLCDVVCDLGRNVIKEKSAVHIIVMAAAFIAVFFFKVNVILVIVIALFIGVLQALSSKKGGGEK